MEGSFQNTQRTFQTQSHVLWNVQLTSSLPAIHECHLRTLVQKVWAKKGKDYMDDITIGTLLIELDLHIEMINNLFHILTAHGLHLKLSKSVFMQPQMDFLGVHISKDGVTVDPAKVVGLREYPRTLYNLKQARGFLGCTGYHCMFCKDHSIIAELIFCLTKKDMPFEWGPEQ